MKLKFIGAIALCAILFTGCEKEGNDTVDTKNEATAAKAKPHKTVKMNSKGQSRLAVYDISGKLIDCPQSTSGDCKAFSSTPWRLTDETFFDNGGGYIDDSFDNNYSDALDIFDAWEVDGVINGDYTVHMEWYETKTFVSFNDIETEDPVSIYMFE